ncbi:hypothetical protein GCM10027184_61990 [Saccharothrix stipae]
MPPTTASATVAINTTHLRRYANDPHFANTRPPRQMGYRCVNGVNSVNTVHYLSRNYTPVNTVYNLIG